MKFSIANLCGALLLTSTVTWAGDINNSSNHSAAFARTLTRNASTEADAAVYNPAGTALRKPPRFRSIISITSSTTLGLNSRWQDTPQTTQPFSTLA